MVAEYSMHGGNKKCILRYKSKENIKMDLREIVCEDTIWIQLLQEMVK
jgi:hypothetical protein